MHFFFFTLICTGVATLQVYGCTTSKGIEVKSSETSYTIKWTKTGMWQWRCGLNECTHQGNEGSLTSDKSFFFFFPTCSADNMKWKTATWFTHEYIKFDSILSVYISICILKTTYKIIFWATHWNYCR